MEEDMEDAYKRGTYECEFKYDDVLYCKAKFFTNPEKYWKCMSAVRSQEQWCEICCYNELGSMWVEDRKKCLNKCNNVKKQQNLEMSKWFGAIKLDWDNQMLQEAKNVERKSRWNDMKTIINSSVDSLVKPTIKNSY